VQLWRKTDSLLAAVLKDERGATAIEYALIAVLLSIAVIAGATVIGNKLNSTFSDVASNLK
jgi:pilus assembly protein Flp/PilA